MEATTNNQNDQRLAGFGRVRHPAVLSGHGRDAMRCLFPYYLIATRRRVLQCPFGRTVVSMFYMRLYTALSLLLLAGCRCTDAYRFVSTGTTIQERMDRVAAYYVDEHRDTSAFVLLRLRDGTELTSAAGVAYSGTSVAPQEDTLYRMASASKIMMYVVAMRLHEEKRLNLDAPITDYSRLALADVYANVTLRDLLDHRSGLPREFFGFWQTWDIFSSGLFGTEIYRAFCSKERLYQALNNSKWHGDVRAKKAQYSNVGSGLLGVLLEDATGETLEQLLQRYVCVPLQLKDTTFEPNNEQRKRIATPCAGDLPWLYRRSSPVPGHDLGDGMKATGGIFSTPRDMRRFVDYYWTLIHASQPIPVEKDGGLVYCSRIWNEENGRLIL